MKKAIFTLMEDQELWELFREGNMQAFKQIYKDYYPLLLDYGRKIKHHDEFIKDCIQELFCDLLNHIDTLGHTDNILYYLFASLRRKIFRKLQYDLSFSTFSFKFKQNWAEN